MKKLVLVLTMVALLAACTQTQPREEPAPDSIAIVINGDTMGVNKQTNDAFLLVHSMYDSLLYANDSLRVALFRANYKLIRVNYYDSLCIKHPGNDKYLKGWIAALFK